LWVLALVAVILIAVFGPMLYQAQKEDRILKQGQAATARVLTMRPTGNQHNDQPEIRLQLEVLPEGQSAFKASITTIMSPVYLARYQPGQVVAVRFLPESRSQVALVPP
jgi:hypothetical protein